MFLLSLREFALLGARFVGRTPCLKLGLAFLDVRQETRSIAVPRFLGLTLTKVSPFHESATIELYPCTVVGVLELVPEIRVARCLQVARVFVLTLGRS